jgi:phage-related protein
MKILDHLFQKKSQKLEWKNADQALNRYKKTL